MVVFQSSLNSRIVSVNLYAQRSVTKCKRIEISISGKIDDPVREFAAENCNSDNQTQMVKLQDFMGQYNSFVSGASDQIKNANQILQGLAKN